jgi:HYR domain/PKD domain
MIDGVFDLAGKPRGGWNVLVNDSSGVPKTLLNGFIIEPGQTVPLTLDIVGLNLIRPGRPQTFHLFYKNNSNVDVNGAFISVGLPINLSYSVRDDQPLARTTATPGESVLGFAVAQIPAGGQGVQQFMLTPPPNFGLVGKQFTIRARQLPFSAALQASTVATLTPVATEVDVACGPTPSTFWGRLFGEHYLFENCPTGQPWSVLPVSCPVCDSQQSAYEQQKALGTCALNLSLAANHAFEAEVALTSAVIIKGGATTVALAIATSQLVEALVAQGIIVAADAKLLKAAVGVLIEYYAELFKNFWLRDPNAVQHTLENFNLRLSQEILVRSLLANLPHALVDKVVIALKVAGGVVDDFQSHLSALQEARNRMQLESDNFVIQNQQLCSAADSYIKCVNNSVCFDPPQPPIEEPIDPGSDDSSVAVSIVGSFDPNDKVGTRGEGEMRYSSGEEPLRYAVLFENLETASAPAQEVVVTDQLDTVNMDLSTFNLGPIAFGSKQVIPPPGASAFATDVDLRPDKNLIVRITASMNPNTGLLSWRFTSIDPATGNPPTDPLAGFLPPSINPPEGDGSVLFTVMPKTGLATGTEIRNKARIIFDVNEPIDTPEWFNTIDNSKPTSSVLPLTASQCESNINVQWAGTDEGSGIASYTIYVSDNGGPFIIWQQNTAATSATYTGQFGHTYAFYTVAQDKTGNSENAPPNADAAVSLSQPAPPNFTSVPAAITVYTNSGATACATFLSDSALGTAFAESTCSTVGISRSGVPSGNIFPVGTTTITYTATDASGNTTTATQAIRVIDNTPPTITAESVSPASLWPPNHTLRDITVNYSAVDNCSSTCTLSVTSNEPVNGTGDGDTDPDWVVLDAHHVRLRAERAATGSGRTYTVTITCTDGSGNSSSRDVAVIVAHNITGPTTGAAFKIGTAVNFKGTFWDQPGRTHTAQWVFDDTLSTSGRVIEPSGTTLGTVTGSYTFTTPGVYRVKMKVTDNMGVTSWVDTAGDLEEIVVVYDPSGGYTIGGGFISTSAGSYPADPSKTGKLSFGFNSKYMNATNPKGETQIKFAVGAMEFNALNYDYLSIFGATAQFRGFGKINGASGYRFILTVIDGQLPGGGGVDRFRINIWEKNTGAIIYDSQMGASEADPPNTALGDGGSIVIQK